MKMKYEQIEKLALVHYQFLESRNANKSTELEALGMIASEVGEAVEECINDKLTANFPLEVADIALRSIGLMKRRNVLIDSLADVERSILRVECAKWTSYRTPTEALTRILLPLRRAINEARKEVVGDACFSHLRDVLSLTVIISEDLGIDIVQEMRKKVEKNVATPPSDRIK